MEESNRQLGSHMERLEEENRQIADEARRFTDEQIEKFQLHGFVARLSEAVRKDNGDGVQLSQLLTSLGVALPTSFSPPATALAAVSPATSSMSDCASDCASDSAVACTEGSCDDEPVAARPALAPAAVATDASSFGMDISFDELLNQDLSVMEVDASLLDADVLALDALKTEAALPSPSSAFSSSPLPSSQPSPLSLAALSPPAQAPALSPLPPSVSDAIVPANPASCGAEGAKVHEPAVLPPLPSGLSFLLLFILSAMQFR